MKALRQFALRAGICGISLLIRIPSPFTWKMGAARARWQTTLDNLEAFR